MWEGVTLAQPTPSRNAKVARPARSPLTPLTPNSALARTRADETNAQINKAVSADMAAFLRQRPEGTVSEWAAVSEWSADTGGPKDAHGAPLRAVQGEWGAMFCHARAAEAERPWRSPRHPRQSPG